MKRKIIKYSPENVNLFKLKLLHWANNFNSICYLESNVENQLNNHSSFNYTTYDSVFAIDAIDVLQCNVGNAFEQLKIFIAKNNDWVFGNFSYDLKNELENLTSENLSENSFNDLCFFVPTYLIFQHGNNFELHTFNDDDLFFDYIENQLVIQQKLPTIKFEKRLTEKEYADRFKEIKTHIQLGNVYEMNFCFEFFAKNISLSATHVFEQLNKLSHAPMSCFYKVNGNYILCASPERFLKKVDNKIISQPIKGTAKRNANLQQDLQNKLDLQNNLKEQTENVMIVDLVRNDLSKLAKPRTVRVEELFGTYTFKQVHQLISTISCEVSDDENVVDIIKSAYPMGSMTGAPKYSAMQIIEQIENTKRGSYSGAVGYIAPNGNFDFNVVIRSLLYNSDTKYLSYSVGSAITASANSYEEYQECLLKAKVIESLFL